MQYRIVGLRDGQSAFERVVLEADSLAGVREVAAAAGLAVVDAVPVRPPALARWKTSKVDVDLFCQELYAFLTAGVMLGEALETLAAKSSDPESARTVDLLLRDVRQGLALSGAMARRPDVFPELLVESIRASERTSDYAPALARFVAYRRLASELRSKVASASIYPILLLAVSALVLLFLVGYVVPRFAQVYADMGDRLPAASRVLLWMGQTIDSNPAAVAALLGTALILAVALWRTGRAARFAVRSLARIPRVRRVLIASEMARLYRTLALLLHGGIPLAKALLITRGLVGSELQKRIGDCQRSIAEGKSFSAGMRDHELSTPVADRFFRVGERTGRLSDMMDRAAEFHEGEVARSAELLTRVIGPVLMLAIGAVIGLVVVLMYLPIFQLADAIR